MDKNLGVEKVKAYAKLANDQLHPLKVFLYGSFQMAIGTNLAILMLLLL